MSGHLLRGFSLDFQPVSLALNPVQTPASTAVAELRTDTFKSPGGLLDSRGYLPSVHVVHTQFDAAPAAQGA